MRRLFWVALGATAGVLVVRKVNQAAQSYTPEGLGRSLAGVADALREMADVVRDGMAEREQELRSALTGDGEPLDPRQSRSLLENPAGPYDRY